MKTAAKDIMNFDLTSVLEDDLVQDAIHVLYSHNLQGIPVLDEDWNLVGFLSESDVLKADRLGARRRTQLALNAAAGRHIEDDLISARRLALP